jgi:RHS repeat-associated protein
LDEVEEIVDADGNAVEESYNSLGNITSTTSAAPGTGESGDVESLGYDKAGLNLECVVTGTTSKVSECPSTPNKSALVTSYSYTANADPFSATKVENPEAHSTLDCYNYGEQEEVEGHKCLPPEEKAKQPAGSLQKENDQLSTENELAFVYNEHGQVTSSTDADGHTTTYEYEEKGNLKTITPPTKSGISATTITVDADSRPHVIKDGAGHIETITYNADDEITELAYTGTGTAKTVKFEYDADGNILKREDPTGTTKYTVDALNRVTKEELPGSLSNSYEYDAASNMTAFTDGGGTTKYKYNGLNELESMLEPGESKETKFAYDNDHRLNKITYTSGAIENYKLEPTTGRPETITAEGVTGTTVPKLTYAYKEGEDDTSLVQSLTESTGNTTSYLYDKLNRLTEAKTKGTTNPSHYLYNLDGAGNRTSQEVNTTAETGGTKTYYVLDSGNELECRQTVTGVCSKKSTTELSGYTYDEAGEEKEITPEGDTSGTTFAYNAASETSSLTPSGSSALALSYGGTGQNDLTALGSSTTLQNSLLGITREVSSAGTSYYARTPNGLLIDQRTPSGHYNPLYDSQGDIIALVNSSGKVERTFRYGPYGENVKSEGTQTIPYPFGYKGGYRMPGGNKGEGNVANGLYHYGQRYYDPTTGRWTQQDPEDRLGSTTQGDRFLFAGADPINLSDPSGMSVDDYIRSCGEGIITTLPGNTDLPGAAAVAGCTGGIVVQGVTEGLEELGYGEFVEEVF